jgi:hypothetical protein
MNIQNILFFLALQLPMLNAQKNELLVGSAAQVITPQGKAYIAGHTHNRVFTGVHDDLYVKAVVVQAKQNTLAILTFDCIGLLHPQLEEIRAAVKAQLPQFPVQNIASTSTHTHAGPDVVGLWGSDPLHSGVDPVYMRFLIKTAAETLVQAYQQRQPAQAHYAQTSHGEAWVYNISEPAELDRSVTILRFVDQAGKNLATLCNFACHPTFLDGAHDQVSADYVWGYYEEMNQRQGGMNLFLQGAIGGWVQPEHEAKTFEQASLRGKGLATEVLRALQSPVPLRGKSVFFKSKKIKIPLENEGFKQLLALGVLQMNAKDSVLTEVAHFGIGEALFATHPGETVPAMSHDTKAMMQTKGPKFVLGLGMDALGYILKPSFFDPQQKIPHSEYLCSVSLGVQTQTYVMRALEALIQRNKRK